MCLLLQDYTVGVWDMKSPTDITLKAVLKHDNYMIVWAVDLNETNIISGDGDGTIKVQSSCVL